MARSKLRNDTSSVRAEPAFFRNIEDDPIRIFELPLEIFFLLVVAKVEEEPATGSFDALLCFRDIVNLETKVVGADEIFGIIEAGTTLAEVIEQRQIDGAITQINRSGEVERLLTNALETEYALIKLGGALKVAHHKSKVSESRHCIVPLCVG